MYHLDDLFVYDYDKETDTLTLTSPPEVTNLSKYVESIDVDGIVIDIGDLNNIRSIEILNPRKVFKTNEKIFSIQRLPKIKYDWYRNIADTDVNVLDIKFDGIGGVRVTWGEIDNYLSFITLNNIIKSY